MYMNACAWCVCVLICIHIDAVDIDVVECVDVCAREWAVSSSWYSFSSHHRMCSLTIECVLFLESGFFIIVGGKEKAQAL